MADGQPEGGADSAMGWGFIIIFLAILSWFMWKAFWPELHDFVRWIRYSEMWLVSLFTDDDYMVVLPSGGEMNLKEWLDATRTLPKQQISFTVLTAMTGVALQPMKWVFAAIMILIGLWAYNRGPGTHNIEKFTLDRFLKFQADAFPIIAPFVQFNPTKQPPRAPGMPVPAELPIFAEALGPEEWLAYHQIPIADGKLDEKSVFIAFSRQLGPRWKGWKNLKPYQQVLLAGFCCKASRKRDLSDEIMGRIANCWSHDKGLQLSRDTSLLREARKILNNKELSTTVIKNCNQHAWVTTALLRALHTARDEGGVLAPAQFVWLRAHDRELWYPLNNLGRQSSHTEAIGAMAHFRIEKRAERPVPKPKVEAAMESIVEYMKGNTARPIPALDYSNASNKRGIKKVKTT